MKYIIFALIVWFVWWLFSKRSRPQGSQKQRPSLSRGSAATSLQHEYGVHVGQTAPRQAEIVSPDTVWVPEGQTIEVNGYAISGGLIYFGRRLENVSGWGTEPALIDPSLSVRKADPDYEGRNMSYWPSYSEISPASRAAYLEWLSTGRKNPQAYIGYVFLYFYGLERRVLADAKRSPAALAESPAILSEVRRLLAIYGHNGSFNGYASRLIDVLRVFHSKDRLYRLPPSFGARSYELPLGVKVALAQMAADRVPLSADWALAWVESDPFTNLRTPAQRCRKEFAELFHLKYTEKFGEGHILRQNKTKLKVDYRPASASFGGRQNQVLFDDLSDVTVLKEPINELRTIAQACTDELDAYSRYLGRNASAKCSVEAIALLPAALLKNNNGNELQAVSEYLNRCFNCSDMVRVGLTELLQQLPMSVSQATFGKREATSIGQLLSKLGVGMEPDPRFGSFVPKSEQDVVLFKMPTSAPSFPSPEYATAAVVLHLASTVAGSDGAISDEEKDRLEAYVNIWTKLSPEEIRRLKAHAEWLVSAFPAMNGIKRRIEMLPAEQKESIGRFLVDLAQSDGYVNPTEVKALTRIYELLGLDAQTLYHEAHRAATEPVTVQAGDGLEPGFAVPARPVSQPGKGLTLDMASIEAKLSETVAVSALLNNIFSEQEAELGQAPLVQEPSGATVLAGLDTEASAFLRVLITKSIWTRDELEEVAAGLNLMLDGTLDTINDISFEIFGGPFFEGDDPIEINSDIAKEIAA